MNEGELEQAGFLDLGGRMAQRPEREEELAELPSPTPSTQRGRDSVSDAAEAWSRQRAGEALSVPRTFSGDLCWKGGLALPQGAY